MDINDLLSLTLAAITTYFVIRTHFAIIYTDRIVNGLRKLHSSDPLDDSKRLDHLVRFLTANDLVSHVFY